MFLIQEKPEMDDFERRKNFSSKEKILQYFNILMDTLTKISQNILAYSFVSEHSKHFYKF